MAKIPSASWHKIVLILNYISSAFVNRIKNCQLCVPQKVPAFLVSLPNQKLLFVQSLFCLFSLSHSVLFLPRDPRGTDWHKQTCNCLATAFTFFPIPVWIASASKSDFPDGQCKKHPDHGSDLNWERACPALPQCPLLCVQVWAYTKKGLYILLWVLKEAHKYSNGAQFVLDMHLAHMVRFSTTDKLWP